MKDYIVGHYHNNLGRNDLIEAIQAAWAVIAEEFLENLIDSMEARFIIVLNNEGGHSKY